MFSSDYYHLLQSSQYGFMEPMGFQDLSPYYYDNGSMVHDTLLLHQAAPNTPMMASTATRSTSDLANRLASPNVSSISSTSSDAAVTDYELRVKAAEEAEEGEEDEEEEGEDEEGIKQYGEDEEEEDEVYDQKTKQRWEKLSIYIYM